VNLLAGLEVTAKPVERTAEAKGFHGLRRALLRGLGKLKIQALLIASVQNLKRFLAATNPSLKIPPARPLWLLFRVRFEAV
jgi:hypothetical protein